MSYMSDLFARLNVGGMGSLLSTPRQMSQDLALDGISATATVLGMIQTPVSFRGTGMLNPVITFDLEIQLPGREPYTVRTDQTVPGIVVGGVLPGSRVFVRVDRNDPSRVAIDFSQIRAPGSSAGFDAKTDASTAAAAVGGDSGTGAFSMSSGANGARFVGGIPPAQLITQDFRLGAAASGIVEATFSVDNITLPGADVLLGIAMRVTYADVPAYLSRNAQRVPRAKLSWIIPGATVPLRGDPASPDQWAIDWNSFRSGTISSVAQE